MQDVTTLIIEAQAENQKRAERIAERVWKDHMLNGGSIQDMLTAAALATLAEMENEK